MSDKRATDASTVSFGERLANSQVFASLFRDGMALVEETASYLDGSGRSESKRLERSAALGYATESMRLTTRLMQLASWLLLHRAVKDGEITLAQAHEEKSKVRLATCEPGDAKSIALLPSKLQDLIARSTKLQAEVWRLDATMHAPPPIKTAAGNPVERRGDREYFEHVVGDFRVHLVPLAFGRVLGQTLARVGPAMGGEHRMVEAGRGVERNLSAGGFARLVDLFVVASGGGEHRGEDRHVLARAP